MQSTLQLHGVLSNYTNTILTKNSHFAILHNVNTRNTWKYVQLHYLLKKSAYCERKSVVYALVPKEKCKSISSSSIYMSGLGQLSSGSRSLLREVTAR